MASLEELKRRLDRAAEIEPFVERRLWVLAVITEHLASKGITPILVGGAAVEFYTVGGYSTSDMDVIIEDSPEVASAMQHLGFIREGRFWIREDIEIALETPAGPLAGDPDRVVKVEVDGMCAYMIGVEDLIIDRLNASVHWSSAEDGRWATRLVLAHRSTLDFDYLDRRAREEGVDNALRDIVEQSEHNRT